MGKRLRRKSQHPRYLRRKTRRRYARQIELWRDEITYGIPAVMPVPMWVDDPRRTTLKHTARRHLTIYRRERTYWK